MDRFESRVFSTETLGAGMTALASQQVKSELPEDKGAMLRELKDFKGFFEGGKQEFVLVFPLLLQICLVKDHVG